MELMMSKFPIKENQGKIWEAWCQELVNREDEVLETLRNEDVFIESCFRDEEYVYIVMVMKSYGKARDAVTEKPFPIDLEHRKHRLETLNPPEELKRLFHFVNDKASK